MMNRRHLGKLALFVLLYTGCVGMRTPLSNSSDSEPVPNGAPSIILLDVEGRLYRYYRESNSLHYLRTIQCGRASVASMSSIPQGGIYVNNRFGELCEVDPISWVSRKTPFDPAIVGYSNFGIGMYYDDLLGQKSAYVVAQLHSRLVGPGQVQSTLKQLDLATYQLRTVGTFVAPTAYVELAQAPNGTLLGLAVGQASSDESLPPYSHLLAIDPSDGHSTYLARIPLNPPHAAFSLIASEEEVLIFLGTTDNHSSSVYRYRIGDSDAVYLGSLPNAICGAGVVPQ